MSGNGGSEGKTATRRADLCRLLFDCGIVRA